MILAPRKREILDRKEEGHLDVAAKELTVSRLTNPKVAVHQGCKSAPAKKTIKTFRIDISSGSILE